MVDWPVFGVIEPIIWVFEVKSGEWCGEVVVLSKKKRKEFTWVGGIDMDKRLVFV